MLLLVFITAGTLFTQPLRSNDRRDRQADWWKGFMNYTVEMSSDGMIYIPSFIKFGLIKGDSQTQSIVIKKSAFIFF
jgi:hypothetical protein